MIVGYSDNTPRSARVKPVPKAGLVITTRPNRNLFVPTSPSPIFQITQILALTLHTNEAGKFDRFPNFLSVFPPHFVRIRPF